MFNPPDIPPVNSTSEERLISREELDEHCPELGKRAILVAEQNPTIVMGSEIASYSRKYGYLLRYSRREKTELSDGTIVDVKSTVVLFKTDYGLVHVAIMFPGPGTE